MTAAPRCCTVLTNSPRKKASSAASTARPAARACVTSANWVPLWLPQMATPSTASTGVWRRRATSETARLWSSRVRAEKLLLGMEGA